MRLRRDEVSGSSYPKRFPFVWQVLSRPVGLIMEDVFSFIISVIFWMFVFRLALAFLHKYLENKVEARQEIVDQISKIVHYVNEERHGDVRYWFDKDTDAFLGQGVTDEEIKSHLKGRFKSHIFVIPDQNIAMIGPELRVVPLSSLVKELETA